MFPFQRLSNIFSGNTANAPVSNNNNANSNSETAHADTSPTSTVPLQQELGPNFDHEKLIDELAKKHRLSPDAAAQVKEILSLTVKYRKNINNLDPEKRKIHQAIQSKKVQFQEFCKNIALPFIVDKESDEPVIFQDINELASSIVADTIAFERKQVIQQCRPWINISHLAAKEIDACYDECAKDLQLSGSIQKQLLHLINFAHLPEQIKHSYGIHVNFSGNEKLPFRLSLHSQSNLLLGFALHDLLFSIGIRQDSYDGEHTFDLTRDECTKLNNHLSESIRWIDDFTMIVGDLISDVEKAKVHISLGQKSIFEIIKNPIRMTTNIINELHNVHVPVCILFNQISLDFTQHAQRDFLKQQFEELYALEKMVGANGKPKRFLDDEPYRSNLNVEQVIKLCPRLNKILKFQQLIIEFTNASSLKEALDMLKSFGIQDTLDSLKQYKIGILFETYRALLGNRTPNSALVSLNQQLASITSIDVLEGKSLELCEELLTHYTGPYFKPKENVYEPSAPEKNALYNGTLMATYKGGQKHKNIKNVFIALKKSPSFVELLKKNTSFAQAIDDLEAELINRLDKYQQQSEGQKLLIDQAIGALETYTARIVYKDRSKVTSTSIQRSLNILAGTVGSDMIKGCATGLVGRVYNMLISLTSSVGNDLQDNINEFRYQCLESIFEEVPRFRDDSESSMTAISKKEASEFLGIADSVEQKQFHQLNNVTQQIVSLFFAKYDPVAIYHRTRAFFSDKFWQLNKDSLDEEIYQMLEALGFPGTREEIDKKYRVNGNSANPWQYAYFQQDLPQYLVPFLEKKKILFVKSQQGPQLYFQKEGLQEILVSKEKMNFHNVILSDQERILRERLAARTDGSNPQDRQRQIGHVVESSLPNYHTSTS